MYVDFRVAATPILAPSLSPSYSIGELGVLMTFSYAPVYGDACTRSGISATLQSTCRVCVC